MNRFCINCGLELQQNWIACPRCGQKRRSQTILVNPPPVIIRETKKSCFYWCGLCIFVIFILAILF